MKAKHHFWSSLAVGGALYWSSGSASSLAGAMIGGFLIDSDHLIDQMWAVHLGAPHMRGKAEGARTGITARPWFERYVKRRKLLRMPLIFHSYELLVALTAIAVSVRSPFLIGLGAGYALHLALDLGRHHHEFRSPLFYLLIYRMALGFERKKLIKPDYL